MNPKPQRFVRTLWIEPKRPTPEPFTPPQSMLEKWTEPKPPTPEPFRPPEPVQEKAVLDTKRTNSRLGPIKISLSDKDATSKNPNVAQDKVDPSTKISNSTAGPLKTGPFGEDNASQSTKPLSEGVSHRRFPSSPSKLPPQPRKPRDARVYFKLSTDDEEIPRRRPATPFPGRTARDRDMPSPPGDSTRADAKKTSGTLNESYQNGFFAQSAAEKDGPYKRSISKFFGLPISTAKGQPSVKGSRKIGKRTVSIRGDTSRRPALRFEKDFSEEHSYGRFASKHAKEFFEPTDPIDKKRKRADNLIGDGERDDAEVDRIAKRPRTLSVSSRSTLLPKLINKATATQSAAPNPDGGILPIPVFSLEEPNRRLNARISDIVALQREADYLATAYAISEKELANENGANTTNAAESTPTMSTPMEAPINSIFSSFAGAASTAFTFCTPILPSIRFPFIQSRTSYSRRLTKPATAPKARKQPPTTHAVSLAVAAQASVNERRQLHALDVAIDAVVQQARVFGVDNFDLLERVKERGEQARRRELSSLNRTRVSVTRSLGGKWRGN